MSEQEFVAGYEQYSSSLAIEQVCRASVSFKLLVLLATLLDDRGLLFSTWLDNKGMPYQFYYTYGMLLLCIVIIIR